jgi:hypothetical protein
MMENWKWTISAKALDVVGNIYIFQNFLFCYYTPTLFPMVVSFLYIVFKLCLNPDSKV